jgi:prefoldin subunit 5
MERAKKPTGIQDNLLSTVLTQLDSFLGARVEPASSGPSEQVSLLEQLHALYEEIEKAGGRRPLELAEENESLMAEAEALRQQIHGLEAAYQGLAGGSEPAGDPSIYEQLESLYAEIEKAGMGPRELAETCQMLNEQLAALYEEIESVGGRGPLEQQEVIDGLDAQLRALYEEKEAEADSAVVSPDRAREVLTSLVDQLEVLYADREHDDRDQIIESLNAQLEDLYAEKEDGETVMESLVDQLHALYEEREAALGGQGVEAAIRTLEGEKQALQKNVQALEAELDLVRGRARRMVSAISEAAFSA